MELLKQEKSKNDFLKACEKFIKEHPSKNITGECENCFLLYIQSKLDFKAFIENALRSINLIGHSEQRLLLGITGKLLIAVFAEFIKISSSVIFYFSQMNLKKKTYRNQYT